MRPSGSPVVRSRPQAEARTPAARLLALREASGNRAFARVTAGAEQRLLARSFQDPGPHAEWIAGARPVFTAADYRDYFQQNFKTVLVATLNGLGFGKFFNTSHDNQHAEQNFVAAWNQHWRRAAQRYWFNEAGQVNYLHLDLNNSPCSGAAPGRPGGCAGLLTEFVMGWNFSRPNHRIHLVIGVQNPYRGEAARAGMETLEDTGAATVVPLTTESMEVEGQDPAAYARWPKHDRRRRRRLAHAVEMTESLGEDRNPAGAVMYDSE